VPAPVSALCCNVALSGAHTSKLCRHWQAGGPHRGTTYWFARTSASTCSCPRRVQHWPRTEPVVAGGLTAGAGGADTAHSGLQVCALAVCVDQPAAAGANLFQCKKRFGNVLVRAKHKYQARTAGFKQRERSTGITEHEARPTCQPRRRACTSGAVRHRRPLYCVSPSKQLSAALLRPGLLLLLPDLLPSHLHTSYDAKP